jgi:aspartate carbamoyltransferase catalytic subunit
LSEVRHLLSINDLDDAEVDAILERARVLAGGGVAKPLAPVVALAFLGPSTRTRLGFAVATARLGGTPIDLAEVRQDASMSAGESLADTLRVLTGMVDALVLRTDSQVDRELMGQWRCPVISGGHAAVEHPTQTLIDVAALESECGPLGGLHVTICGDLGMRAVRSLLSLLARRPPAEIVLVAPPGRDDPGPLPMTLKQRVRRVEPDALPATDVLYLPGLPERGAGGRLDAQQRSRYAATMRTLESLNPSGVLLSPLPLIDEVDDEVRRDPRLRAFEQSDRGMSVRIAVLEHMICQ